MKCVIYTRFAPRPDAADSRSCEWQRAECEQYAYRKGWPVLQSFDDPDRSGADAYRDTLWMAIKALKKGDTLLVWKWDRLARDLMLSLQIERAVAKRGATVTAIEGDVPGNNPHAEFTRHILMSVNELERKMIRERTSAAMLAHQRAGLRMSAKIPYGYAPDPNDNRRIVENAEEMATLDEIWRFRLDGKSFNAIARELDPKRSRSGRWHPEVIRHICGRLKRERG